MTRKLAFFLVLLLVSGPLSARTQAADDVYPVAILRFSERGREVAQQGQQVTDLLFANLAADPKLFLVDREDLEAVLKEQELSLSGAVKSEEAAQVGQLTGARVLVTGSVLQVGNSRFLIAKVIGTETSRVLGASVKGVVSDELDGLVEQLAEKVGQTISEQADQLVAKSVTQADRIAALKKALGERALPSLTVSIPEHHAGQATIDPAAETELSLFAAQTGFQVLDPAADGMAKPDVRVVGEAFSEFAGRRGNLVSVKARVEVKAVDRATGRLLAADRQVTIAVDLAEQIAAKKALGEAGARIAERLLPKLAGPQDREKGAFEK